MWSIEKRRKQKQKIRDKRRKHVADTHTHHITYTFDPKAKIETCAESPGRAARVRRKERMKHMIPKLVKTHWFHIILLWTQWTDQRPCNWKWNWIRTIASLRLIWRRADALLFVRIAVVRANKKITLLTLSDSRQQTKNGKFPIRNSQELNSILHSTKNSNNNNNRYQSVSLSIDRTRRITKQ